MTQNPTIGRMVRYVPTDLESEKSGNAKELPAMIVKVWNPTMVNLQVFPDNPNGPYWKTSVELDTAKRPASWHWPTLDK